MSTDVKQPAAGQGTTAGDQFRLLAANILQVLRQADRESSALPTSPGRLILESLQAALVRSLEGAVLGLAGELRNELPIWLAASEQLEKLAGSRYLPSRQAVLDLREDLKLAEEHATRMIQALESLSLRPPATPDVAASGGAFSQDTRPCRPDRRDKPGGSPTPAQTPPAVAETVKIRPGSPPTQAAVERPVRAAPPEKKELAPPKTGPHGNQLVVACPDCGSAGTIGWDRLGHVLACKGCARNYRVGSDGRMVAVMQTAAGRWVETAKHRPRRAWKSLVSRRSACAAVVLGVFLPAAWLFARPVPPPLVPDLPRELEPRAELLSRAWLTKDLPLLRRLTLTTYERSLFGWLRRRPPPRKLSADEAATLKMEIYQRRKAGRVTSVTVRIRGVPGAKGVVDFTQTWEERDGTWLFLPPQR